MLEHYSEKQHPMVVSLGSSQVWCYVCDEDFDVLMDRFNTDKNRKKAESLLSDIRTVLHSHSKKSLPVSIPPPLSSASLSSVSPPIKGLNNMGNTCFFNSALQCLNATVPLVESCGELRGGAVCSAFARTIWSGMRGKSGRDYRPAELHTEIVRRFRQFKGYGQHDSHELLRCLLDAMATEENKAKIQPSIIENVFKGELISSVLCENCGIQGGNRAMSRSIDPIMDLSLEMTRKSQKSTPDFGSLLRNYRLDIDESDFMTSGKRMSGQEPELNPDLTVNMSSVEGCLAAFTRCELMADRENLYSCDRCKGKSRAIRRLLIARPPEILVIHLKRFSTTGRHSTKLTSFVSYPAVLDITSYCVSAEHPVRYSLYAISVHSGGINGGHYVAYVKHGGEWYHCSDSHVSKVRDTEVLRQQAYILFYQSTAYEPRPSPTLSTTTEEHIDNS